MKKTTKSGTPITWEALSVLIFGSAIVFLGVSGAWYWIYKLSTPPMPTYESAYHCDEPENNQWMAVSWIGTSTVAEKITGERTTMDCTDREGNFKSFELKD